MTLSESLASLRIAARQPGSVAGRFRSPTSLIWQRANKNPYSQ